MSSIGTTCAYPPPAAPPFMPKDGPRLGSRRHTMARLPIWLSASPRPTVVVVLPSPASVGDIAVRRIRFPFGRSLRDCTYGSEILALWRPYSSRLVSGIPSFFEATSAIGHITADWE